MSYIKLYIFAVLNKRAIITVQYYFQTSEEVDKLYWKQQQAEWEQRKQDLLSAFTHSGTDLLNITVQQQVIY